MKYRIKNWSSYQHYKTRNPPWIKLHVSLLSSRDWVTLDDASRVLAVACMLLASKSEDGSFDGDPEYVKRVAYLNTLPNFGKLVSCGFLLADASMLQADARPETEERQRREETEKETETPLPPKGIGQFFPTPSCEKPVKKKRERKEDAFDPLAIQLPDSIPRDVWADWVRYRAVEKKKPLTETTVRYQLRALSGFSDPPAVIRQSIANGWMGLFALKAGSVTATDKQAAESRIRDSWLSSNPGIIERKMAEAEVVVSK